jgi:membrane protein
MVGLGAAFTVAWNVARFPVLFVGVVIWAAGMFHHAPSRSGRWRDTLPGALLTTVLWLAATGAFHLYLRIMAGSNPVIGAFGGGVVVMMWVYLLSLALLLGGELNATLRATEGRRTGSGRAA